MSSERARSALVTGGAIRVGRAISLELARAGYDVAVHYHGSRGAARDTTAEIRRLGRDAVALGADLTEPEEIPGLVEAAEAKLRGLDLLVNNAAVFLRARPGDVSLDHWERTFALNARAPFLCAREAARRMAPGGCVVNVTDVAATQAWPAYAPYAASKAALASLTRSLARAFAPEIRVNAVAPGTVLLPEGSPPEVRREAVEDTALGRIGRPEDVARAVVYLAEAGFVTGETITVDGGQRLGSRR